MIRWRVVVLMMYAFALPVSASDLGPPVLQPKTYPSPSGKFALEVDPSTMHGQGEASYRLTNGGKEVWFAKLPFTLWEAAVADDGTSAGYAYDNGPEGFMPNFGGPKPAQFHIVILDPAGKIHLQNSTDRANSRFLHDSPNPLANGLFIDDTQRRLVVRIRNPDINAGGEQWRIFDLATGGHLGDIEPPRAEKTLRWVVDARCVAGTPLVLVHWWYYNLNEHKQPGGAFTLIDLTDPKSPTEEWQHLQREDYMTADAQSRIRSDGAILRCDEPKKFDLHFVEAKKRVTFEVSREVNRWVVRETARADYAFPALPDLAEQRAKLPAVALKPLGELKLEIPRPASSHPVRNVESFDIDDRGRIGLLRNEPDKDNGCSLLLLDANGQVLIDATAFLTPADAKEVSHRKILWLRGDRWLITGSQIGIEGKSLAWFVSVDADRQRAIVDRIGNFQASSVESLVSTRDGGFVLLCNHRHKNSSTDELCRYDRDGQRIWLAAEGGKNDFLFSPEDIAFDSTGAGSIVILDNIRKVLQIVDLDGVPKRRIDLTQSFGQEPNYPTQVKVEPGGTLVVADFNGKPPIWRLKNDGTRIESFTPQFADGRKFNVRGMKIGPEDRLWACDREMIYRLDAKGVVDRQLGEEPGGNNADIGALAISSKGETYIAASRGGAVRAFDPSGKLLRTFQPLPTDFDNDDEADRLTVDGAGDVYVAKWDGPYLHFKADGTRIGWEKLDLDRIAESWTFVPGTRKRWVKGYGALWLVDESGKPAREIRRQPDNRWLAHPGDCAVAADGSLAVCADNRVCFYTAAGEPLRTIELPFDDGHPRVAFDGRHAVLATEDELFLADARDGSLRRLTFDPVNPNTPTKNYWRPVFTPDAGELWLIDLNAKGTTIRRHAIDG